MLNKNILQLTFVGCLVSILSLHCHAQMPGAYIGVQLGVGHIGHTGINQTNMNSLLSQLLNNVTINSFTSGNTTNGLAGRVFIGIQENCYWGGEFGYSRLPNLPVRSFAQGTAGFFASPYTANTSGSLKVVAYDLVGKGTWPLPYHFNLFGKLGLAFIDYRPDATIYVNRFGFVTSASQKFIKQRYYPTFGLGASYNFSPCIASQLSWTRIQSLSTDQLGSTDLLSLDFVYYMGQF